MSKVNPFWTAKQLSAREQTETAFICLWRDITFEWSRINYNFCLKENKVFKRWDRNRSLVFEAISYLEILPVWLQTLLFCLDKKKRRLTCLWRNVSDILISSSLACHSNQIYSPNQPMPFASDYSTNQPMPFTLDQALIFRLYNYLHFLLHMVFITFVYIVYLDNKHQPAKNSPFSHLIVASAYFFELPYPRLNPVNIFLT